MLIILKLINIFNNVNNNLKMNFYKINIFPHLLLPRNFINIKSNFHSGDISVLKKFFLEKLGS